MNDPHQLPFTGEMRLTMQNGTTWLVRPIREEETALHGRCLLAAFLRPELYWDEGYFRLDLIEAMEPQLDVDG
jgi:hypothetical protein